MVHIAFLFLASACLLLSQTHTNAQSVAAVSIEAETTAANQSELAGRIMWRSNASHQKTVLLNATGESLDIPICVGTDGFFTLTELKYSNDGSRDKLEAFLDGESLGSFYTFSHSDSGHKWNQFLSYSKFLTKPKQIAAGRHVLNIKAVETDSYGVELDAVTVRITGPAARSSSPSSVQCWDDTTPVASTSTSGTTVTETTPITGTTPPEISPP